MNMDLSVVYFITNLSQRGVNRVNNSLYSIRNQKDIDFTPNIIVVDVSNDKSFAEVDKYCRKYKAVHIYSKLKNPVWSKCVSLNFGIKFVNSEYVMCADIDNIYDNNFFEIVNKRKAKNKMLLCKVFMSKRKHVPIFDRFETQDFEMIKHQSKLFNRDIADGACQLATLSWFKKMKGYNEAIKMWGGMDNEIHRLAELSGLTIDWIDNTTSILHQFHKDCKHPSSSPTSLYKRYGVKVRKVNFDIVNRQKKSKIINPKRNQRDWGKLDISLINDYRG